jgi:hypothetical protein
MESAITPEATMFSIFKEAYCFSAIDILCSLANHNTNAQSLWYLVDTRAQYARLPGEDTSDSGRKTGHMGTLVGEPTFSSRIRTLKKTPHCLSTFADISHECSSHLILDKKKYKIAGYFFLMDYHSHIECVALFHMP